MVAPEHPLAGRDAVSIEELAQGPLPHSATPIPEYWQQTLVPTRTPGGRPTWRGPKVSSFQELAAVVAAGEAISLVHGDAARYYQWHGLRYLRPYDAPMASWALIWPTAGETGLVRALARAAQETGSRAGTRPEPDARAFAPRLTRARVQEAPAGRGRPAGAV